MALALNNLKRVDMPLNKRNQTPRKGKLNRKNLHWLFNKFGFKLDIQTNLKITDYLDITPNLYNGTMSPCLHAKQTQI